MKILSWLRSLFSINSPQPQVETTKTNEKWKLVHTYDVKVEFTSMRGKESGTMFFHMHESDQGSRKIDVTSTINMDNVEDMAKLLPEYNMTVYPWLHGRYVPGIPPYSSIDSIDVQKRLSE